MRRYRFLRLGRGLQARMRSNNMQGYFNECLDAYWRAKRAEDQAALRGGSRRGRGSVAWHSHGGAAVF